MDSWSQLLPEYQIMRWDETNFDVNSVTWTKEAYEKKKYAFVSDYVRLVALEQYGGIYFDTDMEVIKNMDEFTDKELVLGLEDSTRPNAAFVLVKNKKNKYMKKLLDKYKKMKFNPTGDLFDICIPKLLEELLLPYGLECGSENIQVLNNEVHIYPREYFYPLSYDMQNNIFTDNTYTIHHFSASWTDTGEKIAVWLRRHKLGFLVKPAWTVLDKLRRIKKRISGDKNEKK